MIYRVYPFHLCISETTFLYKNNFIVFYYNFRANEFSLFIKNYIGWQQKNKNKFTVGKNDI
jgi:hypothetical protein